MRPFMFSLKFKLVGRTKSDTNLEFRESLRSCIRPALRCHNINLNDVFREILMCYRALSIFVQNPKQEKLFITFKNLLKFNLKINLLPSCHMNKLLITPQDDH